MAPEKISAPGEKATVSRGLYTVDTPGSGYSTCSLLAAARVARAYARDGWEITLKGPEGFRERFYPPSMAGNARWHYVERCPACAGFMYPGSDRCRRCWKPSERHLDALRRLNEEKRKK